jgi:hypothetical protein
VKSVEDESENDTLTCGANGRGDEQKANFKKIATFFTKKNAAGKNEAGMSAKTTLSTDLEEAGCWGPHAYAWLWESTSSSPWAFVPPSVQCESERLSFSADDRISRRTL